MHLVALSAFTDNHIWMLHDGMPAFMVDPGDATPPTVEPSRLRRRAAAILVTHHAGFVRSVRACAKHESKRSMLRTAVAGEPGSAEITLHTTRCAELRAGKQITLRATIDRQRSVVSEFAALHEWKNHDR